ncbi:MAG: M24 family metallopeptidase [Thermoproteus sp. AZ2]|jgi:Xaa-Pro dipeptidase|uniref:M24 family metallopeptidase n=1 Tax=Thermoproteus sp. AZ2 TaxID=1609232 RepID=A0ACC6UZL7_9CREN
MDKLRRIAGAFKDYDYVVLTKPGNLAYAVGFPDALALVVDVRTGGATLYASRLDYWRASAMVKAARVVAIAGSEIPPRMPGEELVVAKDVKEALKGLGGRIASDGGFGEDASAKLLELRAVKSPEELELMKTALKITEEALSGLGPVEGLRERDVAAKIYKAMVELGSDGVAFEPIVGSGPNAAWPHYNYGDRRISAGDAVVVDIGARYRLYCADMTRTLLIGPAPQQIKDIVYAVYEAAKAAERAVKPGAPAREVDLAARKVLEEYGFGRYYIHSTGHGVGVEVHEPPRVAATSEDALREGMVITIEPGVYVNGVGGARIENMVYVASTGAEVLNKLPYII